MRGDRENADGILEYAAAGRALGAPMQRAPSGDLEVVVEFEGGALVGLIDGLGHGPEAAEAARAAAVVLKEHAQEKVVALLERCHEALRRTRGAAMTLVSLNGRTSELRWSGVGNVEALLVRADARAEPGREGLCLRGGVVGYSLPPLRESALEVSRGDTLVLVTDGVRSDFTKELGSTRPPRYLAEAILAGHARETDDALALVARYRGLPAGR